MRRANLQTISWFLDLYRRKRIDLDPPFQRRSVWNQDYKDLFIDTILLGYPAPAIFLHEEINDDGIAYYKVVDGKQRLSTIYSFINNEFQIYENTSINDIEGLYFKDLDRTIKDRIYSYQFSIEYLDSIEENLLNNIFDRINRNVSKLTRQELRHAKFDGEFISLIEKLNEYMFGKLQGNFPQIPSASKRQMKDVEMVTNLVLLIMYGNSTYRQDDLDRIYGDLDEVFEEKNRIENEFKEIIKIIKKLSENQTIRNSRLKNQVDFYTLFGVIKDIYKLDSFDYNHLENKLMQFVEDISNPDNLEQNDKLQLYYESARSASRNISSIKNRYFILMEYIDVHID